MRAESQAETYKTAAETQTANVQVVAAERDAFAVRLWVVTAACWQRGMQRPGSLDRGGGRNPLAQRRMLSGSSTSASSQEGVAATHCNRYDLADAVSDSIFEAAGGEAVLGGLSAEDRITHLVTRHNWHPMVALKVSEGFGTAGHSPSSPALRNPQPT